MTTEIINIALILVIILNLISVYRNYKIKQYDIASVNLFVAIFCIIALFI